MPISQKKYPLCGYICRSDVLLSLKQQSQYILQNADKCSEGPWSAKWLIRRKTDSMWSLDSTQLMWLLDSFFSLLLPDSEFLCSSSALTPSLEHYYPIIPHQSLVSQSNVKLKHRQSSVVLRWSIKHTRVCSTRSQRVVGKILTQPFHRDGVGHMMLLCLHSSSGCGSAHCLVGLS